MVTCFSFGDLPTACAGLCSRIYFAHAPEVYVGADSHWQPMPCRRCHRAMVQEAARYVQSTQASGEEPMGKVSSRDMVVFKHIRLGVRDVGTYAGDRRLPLPGRDMYPSVTG